MALVCPAAGACVGSIDDAPGASWPPATPRPPGGSSPTPDPPPSVPGGAGMAIPPGGTDPGRVAMRRLNRTEYNNTVRDLLGTELRPADAFEPDRSGLGFDNNGDVQTLSPLQVEQYTTAAEALIDEARAGGAEAIAAVARVPACDPDETACVQRLLAGFARRAWRRPPTAAETARLVALADSDQTRGEDPLGKLAVPLTAVLASPHFLFRVELDADPGAASPRALDDHEIASRLSYLIYSSMPDDPLAAAADRGQLRTPGEVAAQARRMLGDARAAALAGSFAAQWLDLRSLASHSVDEASFGKAFDATLAALMEEETSRFFLEFLNGDSPISGMLTARFTFLDARLARHYGLSSPGTAPGLTRVELVGEQRGGLLTHASVLTATSPPNHTSPVARGAWVLSSLLCSPPPPPPANVPPLPEPSPTVAASLRARLEAHRSNPACAGCHVAMDPIGFGLEHYDGIGRWRTTDGPIPIDASGMLPDGSTFDGALALAALLAKDPRLPACLTQKLYTFALGRAPDGGTHDRAYLERITALAAGPDGVTLHRAIAALVTSDPFRLRRVDATAGGRP